MQKFVVQRNLAVFWLVKTCIFSMTQGTQSLRMKMQNAELNFVGATVICDLQP